MVLNSEKSSYRYYIRDPQRSLFKIIFTEALLGTKNSADGQNILISAINKTPVIETWVDIRRSEVIEILPPPSESFYNGVPVPIF